MDNVNNDYNSNRTMNQGERDEVLFKLATAHYNPGQIRNPGGNPPVGLVPEPNRFSGLSDHELTNLAESIGLGKAPSQAKSDCDIYMNGSWSSVSLKSNRGSSATILNHTHRTGVLAAASRIGYDIQLLDRCVQQYHDLRGRNIIPEDISNADPNSPFGPYASSLIPIVNYFLMRGTGGRDSPYPAQYVGIISDPLLGLNGISITEAQNYITNNWFNIRFCMRHKNPSSAPHSVPWNVIHDGRVRGELHIRLM